MALSVYDRFLCVLGLCRLHDPIDLNPCFANDLSARIWECFNFFCGHVASYAGASPGGGVGYAADAERITTDTLVPANSLL
ncbi:hypothetical protein DEU51_12439 [Pseudomonas jessenii]|uniref:Uncharacterized protein n=1 Tax=Pseudomonas jessenii TaxID=77298 RepID=A0A370S1D5_PSEJE|nr:hypothetical protein DEU51_12439 [Pseudomonas jessenii]